MKKIGKIPCIALADVIALGSAFPAAADSEISTDPVVETDVPGAEEEETDGLSEENSEGTDGIAEENDIETDDISEENDRKMEKAAGPFSLKGTFTYMAPEVYHGEPYGTAADQYSLGLVLYRLLNNNRDPFIDPKAPFVSFNEREEALGKRMEGEVLPNPENAKESLARIVRKACSYRPENRFQNISQMKDALEAVLRGEDFSITNLVEVSEAERQEIIRNQRQRKRGIVITIIAVCLAVVFGYIVHTQLRKSDEEILFDTSRKIEEQIRETGPAMFRATPKPFPKPSPG